MSIRDEITRIINNEVKIRNIEQLSIALRVLIYEVIDEILLNYGYKPSLSECYYLIVNDDIPHKCANPTCDNIGKFNRFKYNYCSRLCSDSDVNRNNRIQEKRKDKIDYHVVNTKSAKTRGSSIDPTTGLNGHQLAAIKCVKTRNANGWLEKTLIAQKSITHETRVERSVKRQKTIETKYGVSHFGGGISKLKEIEIFGSIFKIQGYEDVVIYKLIESGIKSDDIEIVNQQSKYVTIYEFENKSQRYFPDIRIKSLNKFIEVKSSYWYEKELSRNIAKFDAVKNNGITLEIIIFNEDDKHEIKRIRKNIKRLTTEKI